MRVALVAETGAADLRAALQALGLTVQEAGAGLETGLDRPRVLLAPLAWGLDGGLDRAGLRDLPTVVYAREPSVTDVVSSMRVGARGVVTLPAEPEQLLAQLRLAVRMHTMDKERKVLTARVGRLRKAYEGSADALFFLDADGVIQECNRAAGNAYEVQPETLVGCRWVEIGTDSASRRALVESLHQQDVLRNARVERVQRGGLIDCVLYRVRGEPGEEAGMLVFERDLAEITELRDAMDERDRVLGELEQRNAELERFTYTVSHDLKSPLVTIRGFLGRMMREIREGRLDRLEHRASRIDAAVNTMEELLDDLLELSRVGRVADPTQRVELEQVVDASLLLVRGPLVEAGGKARVQGPLPVVRGDPTRLREVFQNLLENAVRYRSDEPLRIFIRAHVEVSEVVVEIEDNGIGIAPEDQERVFGLFERGTQGEGTGIGLAIVRRILQVHGGQVGVRPATPRGSVFWLRLPLWDGR